MKKVGAMVLPVVMHRNTTLKQEGPSHDTVEVTS
jgi:hypothetical protein